MPQTPLVFAIAKNLYSVRSFSFRRPIERSRSAGTAIAYADAAHVTRSTTQRPTPQEFALLHRGGLTRLRRAIVAADIIHFTRRFPLG
jgi:hypothetical protein